MSSQVKVISIPTDPEEIIIYCARVSSEHQENPEIVRLLKYLITHQHWSPFEMVNATLEITTSRMIAAQILRHRSFSFQELSQRYKTIEDQPELLIGRKPHAKNRQSSVDELSHEAQAAWLRIQDNLYEEAYAAYEKAISIGVAREQARALLPLATPTRLYMAGTIRSWIHYIQLRTQPETQQEHRDVALACREQLSLHLPNVAEALGWV